MLDMTKINDLKEEADQLAEAGRRQLESCRRLLQSIKDDWKKLPDSERETDAELPDANKVRELFDQYATNAQRFNAESSAAARRREGFAHSNAFLDEQYRMQEQAAHVLNSLNIPITNRQETTNRQTLIFQAKYCFDVIQGAEQAVNFMEGAANNIADFQNNVGSQEISLEVEERVKGLIPQMEAELELTRRFSDYRDHALQHQISIERLAKFRNEIWSEMKGIVYVRNKILEDAPLSTKLANEEPLGERFADRSGAVDTVERKLNDRAPWLEPEDREMLQMQWHARLLSAILSMQKHSQTDGENSTERDERMNEIFQIIADKNPWPPTLKDLARLICAERLAGVPPPPELINFPSAEKMASLAEMKQSQELQVFENLRAERSRLLQTPEVQDAFEEQNEHIYNSQGAADLEVTGDVGQSLEKNVAGLDAVWNQMNHETQEGLQRRWTTMLLQVEEWAVENDENPTEAQRMLQRPQFPPSIADELLLLDVQAPEEVKNVEVPLAPDKLESVVRNRLRKRGMIDDDLASQPDSTPDNDSPAKLKQKDESGPSAPTPSFVATFTQLAGDDVSRPEQSRKRPRIENRGVWLGEKFEGVVENIQGGVVYIKQTTAAEDKPQSSGATQIVRAVDQNALVAADGARIEIGARCEISISSSAGLQQDKLPTGNNESVAIINELAPTERDQFTQALAALFKERQIPLKADLSNAVEMQAAKAGRTFTTPPLFIDSKQRAYYYEPGALQGRARIAVVTLARRNGECLAPGVELTVRCDQKKQKQLTR